MSVEAGRDRLTSPPRRRPQDRRLRPPVRLRHAATSRSTPTSPASAPGWACSATGAPFEELHDAMLEFTPRGARDRVPREPPPARPAHLPLAAPAVPRVRAAAVCAVRDGRVPGAGASARCAQRDLRSDHLTSGTPPGPPGRAARRRSSASAPPDGARQPRLLRAASAAHYAWTDRSDDDDAFWQAHADCGGDVGHRARRAATPSCSRWAATSRSRYFGLLPAVPRQRPARRAARASRCAAASSSARACGCTRARSTTARTRWPNYEARGLAVCRVDG